MLPVTPLKYLRRPLNAPYRHLTNLCRPLALLHRTLTSFSHRLPTLYRHLTLLTYFSVASRRSLPLPRRLLTLNCNLSPFTTSPPHIYPLSPHPQ